MSIVDGDANRNLCIRFDVSSIDAHVVWLVHLFFPVYHFYLFLSLSLSLNSKVYKRSVGLQSLSRLFVLHDEHWEWPWVSFEWTRMHPSYKMHIISNEAHLLIAWDSISFGQELNTPWLCFMVKIFIPLSSDLNVRINNHVQYENQWSKL